MQNLTSETSKVAFSVLFNGLSQLLSPETLEKLKTHIPDGLLSSLDICPNPEKPQHSDLSLESIFNFITLKAEPKSVIQPQKYAIRPLSPENIFPQNVAVSFNQAEWEKQFLAALADIPKAHQNNLPLWLDHFDTFLQCHTSLIAYPSKNDISFYDYIRTESAVKTAAHFAEKDEENNILLIQGDFFGIQDFIFSGGSQTNKNAAKLLRGRSFQVSLFTELAGLKILEKCDLPTTSQVMNAAGKFLIIAPNNPSIRQKIKQVQQELDTWFIQQTYGLAGLGIATLATSQERLENVATLGDLRKSLFEQLEITKLQRLNLTEKAESVLNVDYTNGICQLNSHFPAVKGKTHSILSQDQISIGKLLANKDRIIVCDYDSHIYQNYQTQSLEMNIFGYAVVFTDKPQSTGDFNNLVRQHKIHRFWDFSLPESLKETIWNGYARRYINAYIPYFNELDHQTDDKYKNIEEPFKVGQVKTFDYIACEDRKFNNEQYEGQVALMTLKGDVDNLGSIFQQGLKQASFAKMAALSRQINLFFSLWLPAYCAEKYPNTYTVFAGGDDFFLIGPWYSIQQLATNMQKAFHRYVANNDEIHFSVGMVMTKVGSPVPALGEMAEEMLEKAKGVEGKNAVAIYRQAVQWTEWHQLTELEREIERLAQEYRLSTSYLYSLIHFCYQAEDKENIENTMWRSRFYYKTARYAVDKLKNEEKSIALGQIISSIGAIGIEKYKAKFSIPLFNYFYQKRH